MPDSEYVSRITNELPENFTDDSSAALNLDHDPKGRKTVTLPEERPGYDPNMVDLGPGELAEYLEGRDDDRDGNNIEKLIREHPGGRPPGSHSGGGSKAPKKPRPGRDRVNSAIPFDGDAKTFRPHTLSVKISDGAKAGFDRYGPAKAEMITVLGETLHSGVSWAKVEWTLKDLAARAKGVA